MDSYGDTPYVQTSIMLISTSMHSTLASSPRLGTDLNPIQYLTKLP